MKVVFLLTIIISHAYCEEKHEGKAPRLPLNDGNSIPALGLGTFLGFDEKGQKPVEENEVKNQVTWALNAGYRLIDTAAAYKNEDQVGQAILASTVSRTDVYLTTKLASNEQRDVLGSLRRSLGRLNLPYVDLYLIHSPVAFTPDHTAFDAVDYVDTWKGLEEAKRLGLAKSIGISNFNISQIERLLANSEIKPAVLQVEVNLNLAQTELIKFCQEHNIKVMAYTPFGSLFDKSDAPPPPRVNDPALTGIAEKYGKTTPQVVLRYLVQKGVIPIPKSVRKEKIEENIDVFDFELPPEEIKTLDGFNKNYRVVYPTYWQKHPYYPYEQSDSVGPDPFGLTENKE